MHNFEQSLEFGASYYAKIVGFLLATEQKYTTVTKYNENTGKPHGKEKEDYLEVSIQDKKMSREVSEEIIDSDYEYDGLIGYQTTDQQETVLGLALVESEDHNYGQEPQEFEPAVPSEVKDFAAKHGLTPKFYLVSYCSY